MLKRIFRAAIVAAVAVSALSSCLKDDPKVNEGSAFEPGEGIVTFNEYVPLASKPVRVHYYIPKGGNMAKMPVLFVLPGTERNAGDYLSAWKDIAARRRVMVFTLEFPTMYYGNNEYTIGGVRGDNGKFLPEDQWNFAIVEALFDKILKDTGSSAKTYDMWGHSAGAQFVHRYLTFMSDVRLGKAVSANAGWYTLPDVTKSFPYGLKDTPVSSDRLKTVFARKLIIALGTSDTDRNGLNTSSGADAQGLTRYERGLNYFSEAGRISSSVSCPLSWTKVEVPGVGHEFGKMAVATADCLYPL